MIAIDYDIFLNLCIAYYLTIIKIPSFFRNSTYYKLVYKVK